MYKISIIIPTIGRPSLIKTLESILKQSYTNWEIIITDDTKEGKAFNIVKNFLSSNIKYVKNNKYTPGPSGNKNNGLDHINGDFFTFVDDDDELLPQSLEILIKYTQEKYDVVISNCKNKLTQEFTALSPGENKEFSYYDFLSGVLDGEYFILTKSSLIGNNRFCDSCWGGEHLFWWKIFKQMRKGIYIDKALKIYNPATPNSVTAQMEKFPERQVLNYYYTILEFGYDLLEINPKQYIRYILRGLYFAKLANDLEKVNFFLKEINNIPDHKLKLFAFFIGYSFNLFPKTLVRNIVKLLYNTSLILKLKKSLR
jgi:GalNAc5-diNAcBac-PP-undecaprenol beta-1,3-glucosyltransferase